MLATECPACGAHNPVSLPTPALYRCSACGYEGLPRAEDAGEIEALARTVRGIERRALQLSGFEANLLTSAKGARAAFLLVFALLLIPTILTTGMVDWVADAAGVPLLGLSLTPALLLLGCGGASVLWLHRRHRALIDACGADPPSAGDEVGRCNVCGAPLMSKPGSIVARCGFCAADNLVSRATMARVSRAHETGIELFERRLRRRQRSASGATRLGLGLVIGAGIFGCAVVALAANHVLDEVAEVNVAGWSLVYVVVGDRVCFGRRQDDEIAFGDQRSQGLPPSLSAKLVHPDKTRVSTVRGFDVVLPDGTRAKVRKLEVREHEVFVVAEGASGVVERPLRGLCAPDFRP